MAKKTHYYILLIFLLAAASVAGAGWLYYENQANKAESMSGAPVLTMKKIVDNLSISLTSSKDGNYVWFFTDKARLFRLSSLGELTEMPLPSLTGTFLNAFWPEEGSDFIAQVTQVGKNYLFYYDSQQNKYKALDPSISIPAWTGNSKQIVYVWKSKDGKSQQLVISNPDGSGYKSLSQLPWPDFDIYPSPQGNSALLIRSHLYGKINKIYLFSLDDGSYQTMVPEGANTQALWSPDGKGFAYLQEGNLMYFDMDSKSSKDLKVKTAKDKFVFDNQGKYLFAAAGGNSEQGDKFVRFDTANFEQSDYYLPAGKILADNLVYSGGVLYFSDPVNGGLYSISK